MKLTAHETKSLTKARRNKGGRPIEPTSWRSLAREHGIHWATLRNRVQRGMTLEEAVSAPILNRRQCGKRAAKARWGGSK